MRVYCRIPPLLLRSGYAAVVCLQSRRSIIFIYFCAGNKTRLASRSCAKRPSRQRTEEKNVVVFAYPWLKPCIHFDCPVLRRAVLRHRPPNQQTGQPNATSATAKAVGRKISAPKSSLYYSLWIMAWYQQGSTFGQRCIRGILHMCWYTSLVPVRLRYFLL